MHQRAHLPKAKVSCLCSKETGTNFTLMPARAAAALKISTASPSDLPSLTYGKSWKATIMSNPDRFVDHFTVDVGLGSKAAS